MDSLTPVAISAMAGIVLSLIFNYIPGLNTAFDRLTADQQRLTMGVILILTAIGMSLWQVGFDGIDWRLLLTNVVGALIGNQSADRISPKPRGDETPVDVKRIVALSIIGLALGLLFL